MTTAGPTPTTSQHTSQHTSQPSAHPARPIGAAIEAASAWPAVVPAWLSRARGATRQRRLSVLGVAAALLGSQALAASSLQPSDVRLLLPSEGLLAGIGDGLRRGYDQAMGDSRACGLTPPSLQLGWLPPGADPLPPLRGSGRSSLLVAPPAAPLEAYGLLADQQRLNVLLPLQRGRSLEGLPQLRGADRLWPIVPARSLEADRLAEGLLADDIRRVMVVRDRSAESRALSDRFSAGFSNGRGVVIGPTGEPISVDGDDAAAVAQLIGDVDWYRPAALVVFTSPSSTLARQLQQANWPEGLRLAWPFPVPRSPGRVQLGVDPLSRGEAWPGFAQRFQERWGYAPGPVESAGYDTGLIAALASVTANGRQGWDLRWFNARSRPLPLCTALSQRRQGMAVRPEGVSSRLDLAAGASPTAALRLIRSQP